MEQPDDVACALPVCDAPAALSVINFVFVAVPLTFLYTPPPPLACSCTC